MDSIHLFSDLTDELESPQEITVLLIAKILTFKFIILVFGIIRPVAKKRFMGGDWEQDLIY